MSQNIPNKIKENILKPLLESRKSQSLNSIFRLVSSFDFAEGKVKNCKNANEIIDKNRLTNKRD